MSLSKAPPLASALPIASPSSTSREFVRLGSLWLKGGKKFSRAGLRLRRSKLSSASRNEKSSVELDVPFPGDYDELLEQATAATELAIKDNKQLMEIEFPTSGLDSVPGDGEGGIEMTGSMQLIREFCDQLVEPKKVTRTRIFFPEANEVKFARKSAFEGSSLKLDYLTKPSFFEDFGFVEKVKCRTG